MNAGASRCPLLAAAAATQETAASLVAGGADTVVAYHSSVYRQRGLPSVAGLLPWASANEQTTTLLPRILAGSGAVPVVATVCANDQLADLSHLLAGMRSAGAWGVLNAPTIGLLAGPVRAALESAGLGTAAEIALIPAAHAAGLQAWCYVFDADWTHRAIAAGADALVLHLGITGTPTTAPVRVAAECLHVAASSGARVPVLLHGGPLRHPADLTSLLDSIDVPVPGGTGFLGASVFEQDPDGRAPGDTVAAWRRHLSAWWTTRSLAVRESPGHTGTPDRGSEACGS
jgi:predicted TIM-barrel enzyme